MICNPRRGESEPNGLTAQSEAVEDCPPRAGEKRSGEAAEAGEARDQPTRAKFILHSSFLLQLGFYKRMPTLDPTKVALRPTDEAP